MEEAVNDRVTVTVRVPASSEQMVEMQLEGRPMKVEYASSARSVLEGACVMGDAELIARFTMALLALLAKLLAVLPARADDDPSVRG